jgi:hypothetical protein
MAARFGGGAGFDAFCFFGEIRILIGNSRSIASQTPAARPQRRENVAKWEDLAPTMIN